MDRILDRNIFEKISNYSAHMHNFNISGLQTIKVTFLILLFLFVPPFVSPLCIPFIFPLSPRCVSPLCLPVVSPQGGDPNAMSRGERFAPTRACARWWKTKASSVFTGVVYEPIRAIPRQEAVAPSMSLKMTYFLQSSTLWQFATLLGPGKRTPPSPLKKNFFLSFPKET